MKTLAVLRWTARVWGVASALFYLWLFARDGRLAAGPYFMLFAAPGFLHVACALLAARGRNTTRS